jgi:hypothetical protein
MKQINLYYECGASRFVLDNDHNSNISAITLSPSKREPTNEKLCNDLLVEVGMAKRKQTAMRGRSLAMEALKFMTHDRNDFYQRKGSAEAMPAMPIRKASVNLAGPVESASKDTSEERFQASSLESFCKTKKNQSVHGTPVIPQRHPSEVIESPRVTPSKRLAEEKTTVGSQVPLLNVSSTNVKPSQLSFHSYASTMHTSPLLSTISPLSNVCLERWDPEVGVEHSRTSIRSITHNRWNNNDHDQRGVTPAKQNSSSMKVIQESSKEEDDHFVQSVQEDFETTIIMGCDDGQRTTLPVRIREQDIGVVSSPSSPICSMDTGSGGTNNNSSCKSNPFAPPRQPRRKPSDV